MIKKRFGPLAKELEALAAKIFELEQLAYIAFHNKECGKCPHNPNAPEK